MTHIDMRHAIIQREGSHATCNQAKLRIYHSCIHTNRDNQDEKNDTKIMLKGDRENIQASESMSQINRYNNESIHARRSE